MKKLKTEMDDFAKAKDHEEMLSKDKPLKFDTLRKRYQRLKTEYDDIKEESQKWYNSFMGLKKYSQEQYDLHRKQTEDYWQKMKTIGELERSLENAQEELARLKLPHGIRAPD